MDTKILYSFTIYFRYPNLFGACELFRGQTTSVGPRWDKSITLLASNAGEAMENVPEGFEGMEVAKIDYPGGWPSFPTLPVTTSTAGVEYMSKC